MPPQRSRIAVRLFTPGHETSEWFGGAVSEQMAVEMVLSFEGFSADIAVVPSLLAVGKSVLGQSRSVAEAFRAD